jgi:hypothetical protein
MKSEFDKHLKQKLDNTSPEEVGCSLNSGKLWDKIEQKKKGKQIKFMPWMSHAAAVAAGLVIGIFFFTKQTDETTESSTIAVHPYSKPAITTIHDTVYLAKTNEEQNPEFINPETKVNKSIQKARPAILIQQQQSQTVLKENTFPQTNKLKDPEHAPEATFLVALPKQVKVLHLSDMDNENTPATINTRKKPIPIFVLSKDLPSETNTETLSMLVVKTLSNSKK